MPDNIRHWVELGAIPFLILAVKDGGVKGVKVNWGRVFETVVAGLALGVIIGLVTAYMVVSNLNKEFARHINDDSVHMSIEDKDSRYLKKVNYYQSQHEIHENDQRALRVIRRWEDHER